MAVSCKIKILQVKQLSCVMQESVIPRNMRHTENASNDEFVHGIDFIQVPVIITIVQKS